MDEQYELISKESLLKLKKENETLKAQLQNNSKKETKQNSKKQDLFLDEIRNILTQNQKDEKELILKELTQIKEINKTTLSNVLQKTQSLDLRLEDMIETLQGLVSNISELIEKIPSSSFEELEEKIRESLSQNNSNLNIEGFNTKLNDIETFMKNLRILLSYLEPKNTVLNKPVTPSLNEISQNNNQNNLDTPPKLNL